MPGNSSSVTGGVGIKTSLDRVTGGLSCGDQKNLEAAVVIHTEKCMALNRGHLRGRIIHSVESSPANVE